MPYRATLPVRSKRGAVHLAGQRRKDEKERAERAPRCSSMHDAALFEFRRDVFGVLLVALKNLQPGCKVCQFCVTGVGNKGVLQGGIDRLVIGHLVVDVGLVESLAVELREFGALICRLLAERLAGVVIFRGYPSFFTNASAFSFTAL